MSLDEEKYNKLRQSLRGLPRIKARNDFESRLHRKILEHESMHDKVFKPHREEKRQSWLDILAGLLRPSYAPAIGLAVVLLLVVVVYFAYYNELTNDKQELLESNKMSEQKKDELVIYVRDENGTRVTEESAKDIALSEDVTLRSERYPTPVEPTTDGYFKPEEIPATVDDKMDVISPDQKLEMEKDASKTEERKIETKSDGIHSKKSGKNDGDTTPYNIRKEDTGNEIDDNINKQETDEEVIQQTDEVKQKDDSSRIARSRRDSLKVRDKEIEEQKDSIEK
jgi:hypothetical protein